MNNTPKTDAAAFDAFDGQGGEVVFAAFAGQLERERNKLREALQSVMDWNPKPEPTDRPQTVARFEADVAKARKVLEETE
jgi:hypothetical protein